MKSGGVPWHKSPLVFIPSYLNVARYIAEVLQSVVFSYLKGLNNHNSQQDNHHSIRVTTTYLEHANVAVLPWPFHSPDLSSIYLCRDIIGVRLNNLLPASRNWKQLPQRDREDIE
jgi:hypothetical protein